MGDWPTETSLYHQVMRKLVSHNTDIHGPFRPLIDNAHESRRHFEKLASMPITTAEVLNLPNLQIRILRQDEMSVSQILKDNPSSVSEVNCFGQNSVHIAVGVGNLKVLQIILRYADALSLNAQDYASGRGRYAIEYAAISQFHSGCHDTEDVQCNCCDILDALLQEGIQDWDSEKVEEVMEEQEEEFLHLEELLEDLKQDYKESPDLGTFVDSYWGPKVSAVMNELNARKLDEHDMRAAQELGITWHSFQDEFEEEDYSGSTNLDYWMERLNAIVPEPDSDIPSAPDLPMHDS
ncbi:hypothetical protein CGCSCA4_v002683 [Colletotrichum siamense]|uniref:Ankyrin repeat protein n=1 Tax=Colletotrichum siamense TaxID=690259 RepID=A0A9P5F5Y9_COLSI|nr:hypothetical protein CGCSCA4_v002683 [Colletotrichum siamense]KAF4867066.1 hypothetical protein CGCSCA2_v000469 [Colletotrichum siamense]